MRPASSVIALYILFATLASAGNLGVQALVVWIYHGPLAVEASMLIGVAASLPIRYALEKRHIFGFKANNLAHDGQVFLTYSAMGLLTTALFFSIEYTFHWLFNSDAMRYLGGAIGLALSYVVKYRLDKRFVFVSRNTAIDARNFRGLVGESANSKSPD